MGGPFYDYDPELESDTKFPEYYEGKAFFYEWSRNQVFTIEPTDPEAAPGATDVEKVNRFLPDEDFLAPIDAKFGPDGSMYVLDWGGGFGRDNPNSGLHRVDYVTGSRSPAALPKASPDSGTAPLEVTFDGTGSTDPEGETLTYAWDFDGDGTTDSTEPTASHTYTEDGVYDARLTVTDPAGKDGTATVPITVGNTRPEVDFGLPPTGSFFEFGDTIPWDVSVTDAEDSPDGSAIDDERVVIQPALGHDAHSHPSEPLHGRTGSVTTSLGGGHGADTNLFYVLDARYEDDGGAGDVPSLTGSDTTLVFPKKRQAEFHTDSEGTTTAPSRDVEGGGSVVVGADGAWASYDPVNLRGVDALTLRVASAAEGEVELRQDAPDGELLGTAEVAGTGVRDFTDVRVDLDDPGESFTLYVVFPGAGERRLNFVEAVGKGAAETTRPEVAITSPDGGVEPGQVEVAAEATDAENTVSQVEFFADGTSIGVDETAPYTASWDVAADGRYQLTAVATNDRGLTTTSRIVVAQVGDVFGGMRTFSNADGEFEQLAAGRYVIDSGGANMWQGTDEYSTIFREDSDRHWTATVRINSQGNSNGSAKAGLIVRNDVTQPGSSPGYAALGIRPSGGFEWLRGNAAGQLVTSTGGGSTAYPAWVRIVRDGDLYTAYRSSDGETFTQIGEPEALPGAADLQDVGLFVTAHSASNRSAVEFQDFAFDDQPDPPQVEVTAAPRCTGPQARVVVSATNTGADPARLVLTTPHGSKTFREVLPGETVSRQFATGTRTAAAGTATVTATNGPHEVVVEESYDAVRCR
jgi:PKD repeat protein